MQRHVLGVPDGAKASAAERPQQAITIPEDLARLRRLH
jgi:hypothetical protein